MSSKIMPQCGTCKDKTVVMNSLDYKDPRFHGLCGLCATKIEVYDVLRTSQALVGFYAIKRALSRPDLTISALASMECEGEVSVVTYDAMTVDDLEELEYELTHTQRAIKVLM